MIYLKNIISNILVLIFGYIGMLILKFIDQTLGLPEFQLQIYLGVAIIIIGMTIRLWASVEFAKNKVQVLEMDTHPTLVTSGPYKYSRNPLYVGILFVTFGFILLAGSVVGLLLLILFFVFWDLIIKYKEEPDLKKQFGKEFDDYKIKVNRWI